MRHFIAIASLLLVSGCGGYSPDMLRHTEPTGTEFQKALAGRYLKYSEVEESRYNWFNAMHFADKGLIAAYGHDVAPDTVEEWHIPKAVRSDMKAARKQLMAALTPELTESSPEQAAAAQFYFDCWLDEQSKNTNDEHIAFCRDNLSAVMDELKPVPEAKAEKPAKPVKHAKAAKVEEPVAEPEPTPLAEKPELKPHGESKPVAETQAYVVIFRPGLATLTSAATETLGEVIQSLRNKSAYDVVLSNRASAASDMLTQERVEAVRSWLVAGGVRDEAITVKYDQIPCASDNASVKRHVEIFLNE